MNPEKNLLVRRTASGIVDWAIEFCGGLMGSYFGALLAALVMAMKDGPAEQMQTSIWNGFGFGFVFWTLSISMINRVLIQGLSRASIGKKLFHLELISTSGPLSWTKVLKRWVLSYASFVSAGAGYVYALFDQEGRTFHDFVAQTDIVPIYEGKTMSVEYRDEMVPTIQQIRQLMVLSNPQAERPTGTIIQLPVREQLSATGSDGAKNLPKVYVNESVAIAKVIEMPNKTKKAA
jgi:hypothetical protein